MKSTPKFSFDEARGLNADTRLRRDQAAAALRGLGIPVAKSTLATMATRGGGPPFQRFNRAVLYRWDDLLAWVKSRLSDPVRSTAEFDASAAGQRRRSTGRGSVAPVERDGRAQ